MNEVTPSASVWWAPETIPPLGKVGQPYFILYESRVVAPNVLPRHEEQPLHLVQVLAVPREQPRRPVHLVEPQAVLHHPLHQGVVAVRAARLHALLLEVRIRVRVGLGLGLGVGARARARAKGFGRERRAGAKGLALALLLEVRPRRDEGQRLRVPLGSPRDAVGGGPHGAALPLSPGRAGARSASRGQRRHVDHGAHGEGPVGGEALDPRRPRTSTSGGHRWCRRRCRVDHSECCSGRWSRPKCRGGARWPCARHSERQGCNGCQAKQEATTARGWQGSSTFSRGDAGVGGG